MKKRILLIFSLALFILAVVLMCSHDKLHITSGKSKIQVTTIEQCGEVVNALIEKYYSISEDYESNGNMPTYNSACITFDIENNINTNPEIFYRDSQIKIYLAGNSVFSQIKMNAVSAVNYSGVSNTSTARVNIDLMQCGEDSFIYISQFDTASDSKFNSLLYFFTDRWLSCSELKDIAKVTLQLQTFYKESQTAFEGLQMYRNWIDTLSTVYHPYLSDKEQFIKWAANLGSDDFASMELLGDIASYCTKITDECFSQLENLYYEYLSDIEFGMYQHKNRVYYLNTTYMSKEEKALKIQLDFSFPSSPSILYADKYNHILINIASVDSVTLPDINEIKTSSVGSRLNIN